MNIPSLDKLSDPSSIVPLGDQAVLVYFADEPSTIAFAASVRSAKFHWLFDVVAAYSSVGIFFDAEATSFSEVVEDLRKVVISHSSVAQQGCIHLIPCCYERQLDLARVAEQTGLSADEIILRHHERDYTVHAIGFAPGFPYLGYLDSELCGVPRLSSPRLSVEPGSVGLTGKQTGIYPLARPGGWNLIGRTPLTIVDVEDGYFPIQVGDRVKFERIDETQFNQMSGERLPVLGR